MKKTTNKTAKASKSKKATGAKKPISKGAVKAIRKAEAARRKAATNHVPASATAQPTEQPDASPAVTAPALTACQPVKLAKYHDVSMFCKTDAGDQKLKYAVDHVKFDSSLSQLQASDGHVAITVPIDVCQVPVDALIDRDKLTAAVIAGDGLTYDAEQKMPMLKGEAVEWPARLGNGPEKYPNVTQVVNSAKTPDVIASLGIPVLSKLVEYAEANGADSIHLAIAHEPGESWKERLVIAPIRFFMQVDVNLDAVGSKTRDVSGVFMPCEPEDRDVLEERLNSAINATRKDGEKVKVAESNSDAETGKDGGRRKGKDKSCKANEKSHGSGKGSKGGGKSTKPTKAAGGAAKPKKTAKPAAGDGASLLDYVNSFIDKSKEWLGQERFGLARTCLNKARAGIVSMNGTASKDLVATIDKLDAKITAEHATAKANGWKPPRKG